MENNNVYIKIEADNPLIIVVYVDGIIFGSDNDDMSHKFTQYMFEMSMVGELYFFLGLKYHNHINEYLFLNLNTLRKC